MGDDGKPNDVISLTGSNVSREIVSKGPEVALTFVTDDLITNSGFKIYFEKGKLCKINYIDTFRLLFLHKCAYADSKIHYIFVVEPSNTTPTTTSTEPTTSATTSTETATSGMYETSFI